ncbi:hypothetical protein OG241_35820 [Streptomyces sp. NBC_01390]|uniref:hypothetical protein n=1 Tax=Streptomyces sp. NBC_01390 TaxID=2903850 RepID=UPI0032506AC0
MGASASAALATDLLAINDLLGPARVDVTATLYARVQLRLHHDGIDLLGCAPPEPDEIIGDPDGGDEPPLAGAALR